MEISFGTEDIGSEKRPSEPTTRMVLIDAIGVILDDLDEALPGVMPDANIAHIVDEDILHFKDVAIPAEEIGKNGIVLT